MSNSGSQEEAQGNGFPDPMLISASEISRITGWTLATVMKKARAGLIPFVPLSCKKGVFLRESFLYWLKNQEKIL